MKVQLTLTIRNISAWFLIANNALTYKIVRNQVVWFKLVI